MRWLKRPERERSESSCAWQRVWKCQDNCVLMDLVSKLPPLTLFVPYRARKVYGESICEPAEKAWLIWKSGAMEKLLFNSARRPEKVWLVRKTLLWTSDAMLSTVPGLLRPSAALRSWNDLYVSRTASTTPLERGAGCEREPGLVTSMGRESAGTTGTTGTTGFSKGVAADMAKDVRRAAGVRGCGPDQRAEMVQAATRATAMELLMEMGGGGDAGSIISNLLAMSRCCAAKTSPMMAEQRPVLITSASEQRCSSMSS